MRQLAAKDSLKTDMTKLPGAITKAKASGSKAIKICQHCAWTNWLKPVTWNAINTARQAWRF